MKKTLVIMVLLAGALIFVATGCNSTDDPIAKTGAVVVEFGDSTKAASETEVNLTFSRLALQNISGTPSSTLVESATTVNILDGGALNAFDVPVGTYHCISMSLTGIEVVLDDGTSCSVDSGFSIDLDQVCLQPGILEVEEGGSYSILVDIPVNSAGCNQGLPVFNFGNPVVFLN